MSPPLSRPYPPAKELWRLQGVDFAYGDRPVLQALSLSLRQGAWHGVLGPNGSGKSTLLDLLAGFLTPQAGLISFLGAPLAAWRRKDLARVLALVPQDFSLSFDFSVREVVEIGLHPHLPRFALPSLADRRHIEEVMEQCGVLSLAMRPFSRLSGGERQRVALARALAQRPQVLLLDEATASLDIRHALELLHLIRRRVRDGVLNVVSIFHDLNLAAFFCDQLLLLHQGGLAAHGPTGQALTPELIAAVYGVEAQVTHNPFTQCQQVSYRLASPIPFTAQAL